MLLNAITLLLPLLATVLAAPPVHGDKHLIKTDTDKPAVWMTTEELRTLRKNNVGFADVTYTQHLANGPARRHQPGHARLDDQVPAEPTQVDLVRSLIATATKDTLINNLKPLSEFHNRYYKSQYGVQSSDWWFDNVQRLAAQNNPKGLKVTFTKVKHDNWPQSSTIARIEGKDGNQETVIMGAHQDSINNEDEMNGRAPGADDDGSGAVTQLEIFRVLLANGYQPKRPIEFHWYSGEEGGLLGSRDIAARYKKEERVVASMFQLDMTGYPEKNPDVGVQIDFTTPDLTQLMRGCISTYSKYTHKDFKCGYACSDHGSWYEGGYSTARPAETSVRPLPYGKYMHSPRDTLEMVSYDHMMEYVKIGLGFVVEMSHQ
jgi:leucyl aminopeptidase